MKQFEVVEEVFLAEDVVDDELIEDQAKSDGACFISVEPFDVGVFEDVLGSVVDDAAVSEEDPAVDHLAAEHQKAEQAHEAQQCLDLA